MAKHVLTEKAVRSARPPAGAGETTLYDGDGLTLRCRVGAKAKVLKAWQFWYARDKTRTRIGLGAYPEVSLSAAREKAEKYRELLRAGITPSGALPEVDAGRPLVPRTVDELAQRWEVDYLAVHRKDKGAAAKASYARHIAAAIGKTRLTDVRKLHVQHIVQPLARSGRGRTAKSVLAQLRQMFSWGIRNDFAAADPTAGLVKADLAPAEQPRERHLSPDEIRELAERLRAARRAGPEGRMRSIPVLGLPTQAACWVMLATLARVGELSAARWEHVDEAARTWTIPGDISKNGKPHLIHLSDFALRHLRHLRQFAAGSAFVLPDRDDRAPLDPKTITKQLTDRQRPAPARPLRGRSAQASALLLPRGPFTSHDLRRTGATLMRAAGVDVEIVELCLNHVEESRLVRTYQRAEMLPERRAAFERLGERLDELVPVSATAHLDVTKNGEVK